LELYRRCVRARVAVFEAVGIAFEGEDLGVVIEAVDHRGGGHFFAEDLAPRAERLVARGGLLSSRVVEPGPQAPFFGFLLGDCPRRQLN
jgi:hypothetical protein